MKVKQVLFALAVSTILLTSCNSREDVTHMSQDQFEQSDKTIPVEVWRQYAK